MTLVVFVILCKICVRFLLLASSGGFFTAGCGSEAFLLPSVAAGASLVLAETCQLGNSTPRFLAAQRSAVSSRREEIAILRWRVNTQGSADLCEIPWVLGMRCLTTGASFYGFCQHSRSGLQLQSGMQYVQRSDCRAANLQSFAAARHFCSAKILAGGLRWGWGPRRSRE